MAANVPSSPPSRMETLASLRNANADGALSTAFITLTTGVFLVGFVQSLGGSAFWVNMLAAIPSLFGVLQIPGAIWGRSFATYKRFVGTGGLLWRGLYVPILFLPLAPIPEAAKLTLLITFVALASASIVVVNPVYNDWLAELVPSNSRGFFFGRRNAITTAVGAGVGIIGALALDTFRGRGQEQLGFTVIYGLALVCAAASFLFFVRMRDVERTTVVKPNFRDSLRAVAAPYSDGDFRRVLLFLALAVLGQTFAGNLFAAFALQTLKLDYKIIQGTAVTYAIGIVLAVKLWGYVSDKYGNRPVLMIVSALLALNPWPWIACVPGSDVRNAAILLISHVFMGAVWSGIALCQFNILLATAKPEDRANYIASGMAVSSLVGGVAPLLGAALFTTLNDFWPDAIAYKVVFATASILRLVPLFVLRNVQEEGARDLRQTVNVLRTMTPRGFRAMRNLARGTDVETREAAIQSVGEGRVGLATDEIIKALHDPLPRVRRQAAATLAQLRDPRAVEALLHQLDEHPDLVEEETVEALGDLGDPSAVPALIGTLQSPRSILRRASARALGQIGEHGAIEALLAAAIEPGDPDLRRASLQALRLIGSPQAEPAVIAALSDPHPSVRIAAAEAAAELELRGAADALRESLRECRDEAGAEVAYALGATGSVEDLSQILEEAERSVSMITRRRCLLGVARLLGVEREAYRLMLLDGMERDQALMELSKNEMRRNRRYKVALDRYTSGDEAGALQTLTKAWPMPELAVLSAKPVPELFLVAAAYGIRS